MKLLFPANLSLPLFFFSRKPYSWMERSSLRFCDASLPKPTAIWRNTKLTPSSTWLNGSCVPSPGRCPGLPCCVSGTCSSVMVTQSFPSELPNSPLRPPNLAPTSVSSLSAPGVKIIFRVGLVLLKCMLGTREKLKACQGQYETMEILRAIEPRYMQEGFLVREVTAGGIVSFWCDWSWFWYFDIVVTTIFHHVEANCQGL